ncbi:hypothetical protein PsorP6_010568 [Peronosclerospora sorghi]|uniref:Uncharacterized protein n=1 Tax=Peronosclerospora sorghi TaxID=230839 RepID=A0ACC0VZ04_9STRA|nr:hypothetical protein PsorP6_010568 [Peronosclerospora sorghi]
MLQHFDCSKQSKSHKRESQDDSFGDDNGDIDDHDNNNVAGENQKYNNEVFGDDQDETMVLPMS